MPHLTWVEIDKKALKNNLAAFQGLVGNKVEIMPVIKSNAYGHGLIETARIISNSSDWLGVYSLAEALTLRKHGIKTPTFVLSFFEKQHLDRITSHNITLPLYSIDQAKIISNIGRQKNIAVPVHVKIDVGTSRLGVLPDEIPAFIRKIKSMKGLRLDGAFSHLADSENFNQGFTSQQIRLFDKTIKKIENLGIYLKYKHLACSAATIINSRSRKNIVRIGISLYGLWPSKDTKALYEKQFHGFKLIPALSWKTIIQQVKLIPAHTYIGYGCSFKTKRRTIMAILPIGYWDGYDRKLSNSGEVLIRGQRARVLGRICMNITMVDVTDIPRTKVGDTATIIGRQGREHITVEELAEKIGTINYEVVTRINPLIKRFTV